MRKPTHCKYERRKMQKMMKMSAYYLMSVLCRDFLGEIFIWCKKRVRFSTVRFIFRPLYRDFLMRVWPQFIPFQVFVSALSRCPLYTLSVLYRFHCSDSLLLFYLAIWKSYFHGTTMELMLSIFVPIPAILRFPEVFVFTFISS